MYFWVFFEPPGGLQSARGGSKTMFFEFFATMYFETLCSAFTVGSDVHTQKVEEPARELWGAAAAEFPVSLDLNSIRTLRNDRSLPRRSLLDVVISN